MYEGGGGLEERRTSSVDPAAPSCYGVEDTTEEEI